MSAQSVRKAEGFLRRTDPSLGRLVRAHGPCPLHRGRNDAFDTLGWSIISQQLSTQAASTIGQRVLEVTGESRLTAAGVLAVDGRRLRRAGLSNSKARFLRGLAGAVVSGDLNFRSLAQLPDERVVDTLVQLPGIGAWTAQMFLMFGLRRADVFSPADVGLQRAAQSIYDLDARPAGDEFEQFAERWRPWRTVACWYLWRHVD